MTLEDRYRRALERIARHEIRGPVNEWSEAAAYRELQDIALEALEPGTMAARAKAEQEVRKRDKDRARQLRKESSAGKRHFYRWLGSDGCIVCILNHGCDCPDLVEVKVLERVGNTTGLFQVGERMTVNVWNLYESQQYAVEGRR